jgi:hypothetical protein
VTPHQVCDYVYIRTNETIDSNNYEEILINTQPNDKDNNARNNFINNNDQSLNINKSVCVGKRCCYQNFAPTNEPDVFNVNTSHNHVSGSHKANSLNRLSLSRHSSISQLSNCNCNKNINSAFYHYSHLHGVSTTPTRSRSRCSYRSRDSTMRSRRSRSDGSSGGGSRHGSSCSRPRTPASHRGSIHSEYDNHSLRDGNKPMSMRTPTKQSTSEISYCTLASEKKCRRMTPTRMATTITAGAVTQPPVPFSSRNYSFRVRSHSVVSTDEQTKNYYYCKQTKAHPSSSSHTMPATLAKRSSSGPTVHRPTPHYDRLPSRARSLGDSRSLDDMEIEIPEYFDSPSKIQWNFFLNLDEQTRRNKQREREELKQKSSQIEQLLKKSSPDEVSYNTVHMVQFDLARPPQLKELDFSTKLRSVAQ